MRKLPHLNKQHLQKPAANITLNAEILNVFLQRLRTWQRYLLLPLLSNKLLEVPVNKARNEKKWCTYWKERNKISPFASDAFVYIENSKGIAKKIISY